MAQAEQLQNEGWPSSPRWPFSNPLCIPSSQTKKAEFSTRGNPRPRPHSTSYLITVAPPKAIRSQLQGPQEEDRLWGGNVCVHHGGWWLQRNGT